MSQAQYATPAYRSSRPMGPAGGTSFYLSHTILRRTRRGPPLRVPAVADAPPGRSFVFPDKAMSRAEAVERQRRLSRQGVGGSLPAGMVGQLKTMGGVYDRQRRCWHVASEMVAKRVVPAAWRGRDAAAAWLARRHGGPDGSPGTAARFQAYVERAAESESGRRAEIECDGSGEISFGTVGGSSEERIGFWQEAEERERPGGRVQHRIIAELPHWLDAGDRRRIAVGFCGLFERLGLPYHAVVHLPDVDEGGDARNVHLHVLYTDRPLAPASARSSSMSSPAGPLFAKRKRAEVSHIGWPGSLRRHFARVVNQAIAEGTLAGKPPPEGRGYYDPRTYREMGVEKMPAQHMGPWRMRLERAGVPTLRGVRNGWKEGAWKVMEAANDEADGARRLGELASRVEEAAGAHASSTLVAGLADAAADLLVVAPPGKRTARVLDEVRRDFVAGRALRRAAWASAQTARLHPPAPAPGRRRHSGTRRDAESPRQRKGTRLREIEAEAMATVAGLVPPPLPQPFTRSADEAVTRRVEAEPRIEAACRRLLLIAGPAAIAEVDGVAAWSTDAVERGGLIERLKLTRTAAAAADRRTAPATTPKMPMGRRQTLGAADREKLDAWHRRRTQLEQQAREAEETAVAAILRLGGAIAAADDGLGRVARPADSEARAWEAVSVELVRAPWRADGSARPVLTWLDGLRRRSASLDPPSGGLPPPPEVRRTDGSARPAGTTASIEPGASPSGREAWIHPFVMKRERGRIGGAARDPLENEIREALAEGFAAIDRWFDRRERAETHARAGPLPTLAPPEEEEAWRRRARQLKEEGARMAAAALAWPPVAPKRALLGIADGRGQSLPLAPLERFWLRLVGEARQERGRQGGPRGDRER